MKTWLCSIVILSAYFNLPNQALAVEPVGIVPSEQKVLTNGRGRYVFGQISGFARHQFMLDTQTGRLWQVVSAGKNKPLSLQAVEYLNEAKNEAFAPDTPLSESDLLDITHIPSRPLQAHYL